MESLNKKQKIIIGIILSILIGFLFYYVYAREDNTNTDLTVENELTIENKTKEEVYSDTTIFVHISGAVNKEGMYELKANSRISDVIEKARRSKRGCIYRRYKFGFFIRRWDEDSYTN